MVVGYAGLSFLVDSLDPDSRLPRCLSTSLSLSSLSLSRPLRDSLRLSSRSALSSLSSLSSRLSLLFSLPKLFLFFFLYSPSLSLFGRNPCIFY